MDLSKEKLDDSSMALESFIDDLRYVQRDGRGQDPMEIAIAARRWDNLAVQYGFEELNVENVARLVGATAVGVAAISKRALIASAHHFGKFVESVQVYFDKSGGKEVDRLRRLLEESQGDAEGVMTNQHLANQLCVNGRVPADFSQEIAKLVGLVDLLFKAVPALAKVNSDAAHGTAGHSMLNTEAQVESFFEPAIQAIIRGGNPLHHFPSAVLTEQFLGGQRMFVEKTAPTRSGSSQKVDPKLKQVLAVTEQLKYALAPSKSAQPAMNPRLPILARHQVKEMIEQCETLTDGLHRLLALAKTHAKDLTGKDVMSNIDHVMDELSKSGEGDLRAEAHVYAGWIEPYFRTDITNQLLLIEAGLRIVSNAHKAFAEYVHVSLQQYK